ncbi:unnamed protein product [Phytomonas sp. EM1]|nr:unnamed protein product [Phytomonas sp. EM1]|eukprot:CCW62418.1 unnamed protein product [Phytomonas sp. isolate EM1]
MTEILYRDFRMPNEENHEDCILSLPCFEIQTREDRPLAPAAEDFPLGCEVELLDIDFAKIAQESKHWEPFMEDIFSKPRRRVKVARHLGDYTFVLCSDIDGFMQVGFTLYRACLSEPKVKTTKYSSGLAKHLVDDDEPLAFNSLRVVRRLDGEPNKHAFDRSISKTVSRNLLMKNKLFESSPRCFLNCARSQSGMLSGGSENGGSAWRQKESKAAKCDNPSPTRPSSVDTKTDTTGSASKTTKRCTRSKFTMLMKQGTHAIKNSNYESAIYYYNLALRESPKEAARVLSSRSVAFLFLGQIENSLSDAERVIALTPESYLGYVRVGNVLRSMRRFKDAQSYYRHAIKRDPTNLVIQKLFFENSIAMLFGSRMKQFPRIKIEYNQPHMRAQLVARCPVKKGGIVFKETTSLMALVDLPLTPTKFGWLCEHCGKAFLEEGIRAHVPGLQSELFRLLWKEPKSVRCAYGCGARYCGVECRNQAWSAQHWVECREGGRWKAGMGEAQAFLRSLTAPQSDRGEGGDPLQDVSHDLTGGLLRVAVRMFSSMVSSVWPLRDAVHMFDWLRVSQRVEGRREQVRGVVQDCYRLLSVGFLPEERAKLTYELFERCYERAASNAVLMCVTGWGDVAFRAQSLRALLDGDTYEGAQKRFGGGNSTSCSSIAPFTPISESSLSFVNSQRHYHDEILKIPPEGTPSMHLYVVAVFELFSMTNTVNMNSTVYGKNGGLAVDCLSSTSYSTSSMKRNMPSYLPNLCIHNSVDSCVRICARAADDVEKGEVYVSAPPIQPLVSTTTLGES